MILILLAIQTFEQAKLADVDNERLPPAESDAGRRKAGTPIFQRSVPAQTMGGKGVGGKEKKIGAPK